MLHQRIPADAPDCPDKFQHALLDLLVHSYPSMWSLPELHRALSPTCESATGEEPSTVDVEDAVANLYAAGLIHRIGAFVFATHTAIEAARLAG